MSDESEQLDTVAEAEGQPPDGRKIHRRWTMELSLAGKGEKDWREEVADVYELYRGKNEQKNSYNILWTNTEILRASSYNSVPKPDVRRRFRDKDLMGKAIGEVLRRGLEYTLDVYGYHEIYKQCVLDCLISGRGVMRHRYKPTTQGAEGAEALTWECVMPEHVQWDDFRHSAGKTAAEWTWVAFRHRMTRDEMVGMFGEIGEAVQLDSVESDESSRKREYLEQDEVQQAFRTAEVWEIWDKEQRRVLFIAPCYTESPLLDTPDPLGIDEFYPCQIPLYCIEATDSTTPVAPYTLYKEQAEELNRISMRVNKIIQAVKFRGIYDATITEMSKLTELADNELVPSDGVSQLIERGGLDKAIWTWPVERIAQVLQYLYDARERTKAVIYELTGISDVVRGSTKASETLGAQQLKAEYAGMRIGRLQSNIQDFIRNGVRIAAGIMAEKFSPQTLMGMTGLQFPSQQQIEMQTQQAMMQWQQAAMMAQQQGQQPPPRPQPPQGVITIEAVMQALRSNMTRSYKVDIETDSTIQQTLDGDLQALGQLGQAVNMVVGGIGPLVQAGVLPMPVMSELLGAITRRARLGNAVEDAIDAATQQAPQQGGGQEEQKKLQEEKAKLQQEAQKLQQEQAAFQQEQGMAQVEDEKRQLDVEKATAKLQNVYDQIVTQMKNSQDAAVKSGDQQAQAESAQMSQMVMQAVQEAVAALTAPKQVVRDAAGRISGVQTVGNAPQTVQ